MTTPTIELDANNMHRVRDEIQEASLWKTDTNTRKIDTAVANTRASTLFRNYIIRTDDILENIINIVSKRDFEKID